MTKTLAPPTPAVDAPVEQVPLTALDRCDRCGAQAYVRTEHDPGPLLWCAHHAAAHRLALSPFVVQDETHRLYEANTAYKNGE